MNYLTEKDFDKAWKIFKDNKKWFPHVRESHVKIRLSRNQVILQDGVLITEQKYKRTGKIGHNTNVITKKGDRIIHQIINSEPKNGNAEKVIKKYFYFVLKCLFNNVYRYIWDFMVIF